MIMYMPNRKPTPRKLASAANARDRLCGTAETTIPTNLKEVEAAFNHPKIEISPQIFVWHV